MSYTFEIGGKTTKEGADKIVSFIKDNKLVLSYMEEFDITFDSMTIKDLISDNKVDLPMMECSYDQSKALVQLCLELGLQYRYKADSGIDLHWFDTHLGAENRAPCFHMDEPIEIYVPYDEYKSVHDDLVTILEGRDDPISINDLYEKIDNVEMSMRLIVDTHPQDLPDFIIVDYMN